MPSFTDIDTHWAKNAIAQLTDRGYFKGYPDNTFKPNNTVTRAECTVILFRIFPDAPQLRDGLNFDDVPADHWAKTEIEWAYQRGFFSGYPDRTFRPDQAIPRVQAIAVFITALRFPFPAAAEATLSQYFDDAVEIPDYAKGSLAAATLKSIVVNYPNVRKLEPNRPINRGEFCAILCQGLGIFNTVSPQYITWSLRLQDIKGHISVGLDILKANGQLVKEIQTRLSALRLYPGGRWLDGRYGPRVEAALRDFCTTMNLPNMQTKVLNEAFAVALLTIDSVEFLLKQAKDRQKVYTYFFQKETGLDADKLAFLDRGIKNSPYKDEIRQFPDRLREVPDEIEVVSLGEKFKLTGSDKVVTFTPYPERGRWPQIDSTGLDFLHPDIQQACVCVGSFVGRKMYAHWLGRNALKAAELWSTTKIIPLLNVISQSNTILPASDIDNCEVRPSGSSTGYKFYDLALGVVNYDNAIATSNSLAALFKQFAKPRELETWLQGITGNPSLKFSGRYGEAPFLQSPQLRDRKLGKVLLTSSSPVYQGSNSLTPYDLTRMVSMLAWHHHLPLEARFPGAQWDSLECLVRAMGNDTARYIDVAIDHLGLTNAIRSPVIISKLGFGRSSIRDRTELVYVGLVQFVDKQPKAQGKPSVLRTVAMALLSAKDYNDRNREATELDARMAAEITEILRRIVTQELA